MPWCATARRFHAASWSGADFFETEEDALGLGDTPRLGIGRDVTIDRAIVDKNARIGDGCRLVNEQGLQEADGDGWHIRSGIIVVPKERRRQGGNGRVTQI